MKKRIIILVILLALASAALLPLALAAPSIYFSAVNDKLLTFKESTMPRYIGGKIYLHYSLFSSNELGVYFTSSSDEKVVMLYSGSKTLTFDADRGTTFDQDLTRQPTAAKNSGGTVFVPADFVCKFFGLEMSVIQTDIAQIVRVRSAAAVFNDPTFASLFKPQMLEQYNEYMGTSSSPDVSPSPSVTPSEEPENEFDDITIFISFYDLSAGYLESVLDKLDNAKVHCSFFVTAAEIAANADLVRRIACSGHTIGIYLSEGTFEEYLTASGLLFEAAKLKTVLVSSNEEAAQAARGMAGLNSLVYWTQTRNYNAESDMSSAGVTSRLSTVHGSRESISFDCSEDTSDILRPVLSYMKEINYNIQRITETSVPIPSIE